MKYSLLNDNIHMFSNNHKYTFMLCMLLPVFLIGCNSDSYRTIVQPEEALLLKAEPISNQSKQVAGIDLWITGVPNRKYKILGVIHDVRRNLSWRLSSYEQDLAKVIVRAGGDGGIVLLGDTKVVEHRGTHCSSFASNDQECGDFSGALQTSESTSEEVTIYSQNRESTNVPLEYKDSHIIVIKYTK